MQVGVGGCSPPPPLPLGGWLTRRGDAELQPKRPESPEDLGERFHAKKERREMLSPQDPRRTQSIRDLEEPLAPPKTDREKWERRRAIERRLEALERELLV